jgi:hypothetical protein
MKMLESPSFRAMSCSSRIAQQTNLNGVIGTAGDAEAKAAIGALLERDLCDDLRTCVRAYVMNITICTSSGAWYAITSRDTTRSTKTGFDCKSRIVSAWGVFVTSVPLTDTSYEPS